MPSVMSFIKKFDLHIEKQIFELNCEMVLSLPLNQKENLKTELEELSSMDITILGIY
jgi:hypothetical protein